MLESTEHKNLSFGPIVATIGAVLIGLGIAWLIALNWESIPNALKVVILVLATSISYFFGVLLRTKNHPKIGNSLLFLGAILYTLTIFLIGQIFNLATTAQANANLLLISWVGVVIASYVFSSSISLILALFEFLPWISLQFLAFFETGGLFGLFGQNFALGILGIIYLAVAVLLYGLTQIHKSRDHKFFDVYRFWSALYILLLTYILSFQILLPILWPVGFQMTASVLIFLIGISIISIITAMIGISMSFNKNKLTGKEVMSFVGIVIIYILLISLAGLVSGAKVGFRGGLDAGLFFMWLVDNVFFIIVILSVIGYGVKYKSSKIVNLGILFFVLDIITRYIGFILDIGGQIGFAVMSIIGGIILIAGGWGIEKWRERLIQKTKSQTKTGYQIN